LLITLPPHVPVPLHVPWVVCVPAEHDAKTQTVPDTYFRHAPAPSQVPSRPQVLTAAAVHSLSGSAPATMKPQVPSAPAPFFAAEHAWQNPVHVVLQQTPSAQTPLVHSLAAAHARPVAFFAAHVLLAVTQ